MVSPAGSPTISPNPCESNEVEPIKQPAKAGDVVLTLHESEDGELDATVEFTCDEEPHMFKPPFAPGYASLHLGQQLTDLNRGRQPFWEPGPGQGDYEIVRKLGWGQEASVWLARRLENSSQTSFVAIKILTSAVTRAIGRKESFELPALFALDNGDTNHPGRPYCTLLLDLFVYGDMHGLHYCLVLEPLSLSLEEYVEAERSEGRNFGFSMEGLRNIVRQVLLAVSYAHATGLVHTDIKSNNIFIGVGLRNEAIAKYLAEHPSRTYPTRHEPNISSDPIITVMSEPLPPFNLSDRNRLRLKLGDFGVAIPMEKTNQFPSVMPTLLKSPEVILGCPWGWQVDIWMVGCLSFDRIDSSGIFHIPGLPHGMTLTDVHLARMQELLGPFPASFLDRCSARDKFFDESGELLRKLDSTPLPALGDLEQRISGLRGRIPDNEVTDLLNFMRRCLTIDPELRPSAEELLKDPFLAD